MNKRTTLGIKVFGWLLISYFFYCEIVPLIWQHFTMAKKTVESQLSGPIKIFDIIKEQKSSPQPSIFLAYIYILNQLMLALISLCSLVGGVGVLSLKKWSRKFVVFVFTSGCFFLLIKFLLTISHEYFRGYSDLKLTNYLYYLLFFAFYISNIIFFTRPNIKGLFAK